MASPSYINGIIWSAINACAAVLMPMALFVFFARSATLETIGAVALATSIIEIIKSFALPGLYEAVLQQTDDQWRCHETAAFLLLTLAGVLTASYLAGVTTLSLCSSSVAAHGALFAVLGSRIVLDLAALQPQALLSQRLAYRRLAVRTMISATVSGIAGVLVTLRFGAFVGLVTYQVTQSLVFLLTTIVGTSAAAFPRLHLDCYRRMRREATLATCVRILAANINYLDQIVAAALIGNVSLALFNLGKRFEAIFVTVAGSFSAILFQPLFARRRVERSRQDLGPSIASLTIFLGLPAVVFVANSTWLVPAVFGQQWQKASAVAAVMAAAGFVRAVGYVPGAVMSISVRNGSLLVISLVSLVTGIAFIALAAPFGILCCALTVLIRHLGVLAWMAAGLRREAEHPMRILMGCFVLPTILMMAAALAGRVVLSQAIASQDMIHQLLQVAASLAAGTLVVALYFVAWFRARLGEYYTLLRARVATLS